MTSLPNNFTPYIPSDRALTTSDLPDKAVALTSLSSQLAGRLPETTTKTIIRHMAVINSYYSNLIEGNNTRPHEIRAAQEGDFSSDSSKRDLQLESLAHIHVQQWIEAENPNICTLYNPDFIQAIHREFYLHVPDSLREIKNAANEIVDIVIPGQWRQRDVHVGRHIAPEHTQVPKLMDRFFSAYHPDQHKGDRKIISVMAAHHRLGWIHPFIDGNGRVMRLFTDASLRAIGLSSSGVWLLSRGLARSSKQYKFELANADATRLGDYDGRGALSEKALTSFCEFMLDTAIDQADYITKLLDLNQMQNRIKGYLQARNDGRVPNYGKIKENAGLVLYSAFIHGKLSRSLAIESCAMPERSARRLLAQLKDEGLLSETSSRSDIYWEIPEHAEPWYFPQLTPNS